MEPISLIVGALVVGASEALKDTASQAVQDSYQGLKAAVMHYWKIMKEGDEQDNENEAKILLDNLEEDPDTFQIPLEKKLTKVIPEPEKDLIEQAQQLYKLLDEVGFNQGKYNVILNSSQGVQVGDKNMQINKFN